jgi:hypothetical protein
MAKKAIGYMLLLVATISAIKGLVSTPDYLYLSMALPYAKKGTELVVEERKPKK